MQNKPRTDRITPRAYDDLLGIGRYTEKTWGKKQRNKYLKELDNCFDWLCLNASSGKHRTDIKRGYYCFPQGSHLVFYLISDLHIDIIGLPHKSADVVNYF